MLFTCIFIFSLFTINPHLIQAKVSPVLSKGIKNVLTNKDDLKVAEKEAKKDQELISEIEAQTRVLEFGAKFWKEVNEFVMSKRLRIAPDQLTAMKYALQIPKKFPSAYQSLCLLKLLEEAKANGFKF